MTALSQLVRLHRWTLNEKRQKLAGLERLADRLRQDLHNLDTSLKAEREMAGDSVEDARALTSYTAAVAERRRTYLQSIQEVEEELEEARQEVERVFQELKRYELGLENHNQREAKKRARREQTALDEIGVNITARRQAK